MKFSHRLRIAAALWSARRYELLTAVAAIVLLAGCGSTNTPATVVQPQGKLYVAVPFFPPSDNGAILRFDDPAMLNGNVTPAATITGSATGMDLGVSGTALDNKNDRLFVLDNVSAVSSILVYDHISTKSGNIAPDRVISGPATHLIAMGTMVMDNTRDILYVTGFFDSTTNRVEILTFKNASTASGNVAPSTILQMDPPGAAASDLALDQTNDRLFLLTNAQSIQVFDHASTLTSGLMVPNRVIAGVNTGLTAPNHMALDPAGRLLVGNTATASTSASIVIFANAAAASGNIVPTATISGPTTGFNIAGPQAMTVVTGPGSSPSGDLYLNVDLGNVLVFKNIGTANGNVSPDHLFFVATNGSANLGLSFDNSR